MGHLSYLAVIVFVLLASTWLEVALRTRVYARWRRLALTVLPVLAVFFAWDAYAVAAGHWHFDASRIVGLHVAGVPVEEVLFFLVVPVAAVLTLEAVRSATGWQVGDELPGEGADGVRTTGGGRP
ncbi:MAG TPA: lycopene cyclase domain-containing protein [Candidatus Nanopelagicales bacterium]